MLRYPQASWDGIEVTENGRHYFDGRVAQYAPVGYGRASGVRHSIIDTCETLEEALKEGGRGTWLVQPFTSIGSARGRARELMHALLRSNEPRVRFGKSPNGEKIRVARIGLGGGKPCLPIEVLEEKLTACYPDGVIVEIDPFIHTDDSLGELDIEYAQEVAGLVRNRCGASRSCVMVDETHRHLGERRWWFHGEDFCDTVWPDIVVAHVGTAMERGVSFLGMTDAMHDRASWLTQKGYLDRKVPGAVQWGQWDSHVSYAGDVLEAVDDLHGDSGPQTPLCAEIFAEWMHSLRYAPFSQNGVYTSTLARMVGLERIFTHGLACALRFRTPADARRCAGRAMSHGVMLAADTIPAHRMFYAPVDITPQMCQAISVRLQAACGDLANELGKC